MPTYTLGIQKQENDSGQEIAYQCELAFQHLVQRQKPIRFSFQIARQSYKNFLDRFQRFYLSGLNTGGQAYKYKGPEPADGEEVADLQLLKFYGTKIFNNITDDDNFRGKIFDLTDARLNIVTNDIDIPWELLFHQEKGFLSLNYPIARIVNLETDSQADFSALSFSDELDGPLKILFVTNPAVSPEREDQLGLANLSETEHEIRRIASVLNNSGVTAENLVLSGDDATPTQIQAALEKHKFHVLHYTGHNVYDPGNDANNGLILAGDETLTPQQCKEAFSRHTPNIIFMNSCTSGKGSIQDRIYSKTPYSFIESFCEIGVQAFIGTLWMVEERMSSDFAIDFYKSFSKGKTIGDALFEAKVSSFKNKNDHCQTWASFVLYGDQNIHLSDSSIGLPQSPFKALHHFTEEDSRIFRGREDDIISLVRDIRSRNYPIIRLDGDSGSGKSSLIHAGVKPRIEKFPCDVVILDKGYENVFENSIKQISDRLGLEEDNENSSSFADFLSKVSAERDRTQTVVVFDQFEKVFIEHFNSKIRDAFFSELEAFVKSNPKNVVIVLIMRADYTGHFTGYIHKNDLQWMKGYIGEPFLHRLSRKQAEQAIREPLVLFGCSFEEGVIKEIVEELSKDDGRIYPPYLQIICDRLYRDIARHGDIVTVDSINTDWNIQKILNEWLKDKLNEIKLANVTRKIIEDVLKTFITTKGIRAIEAMSPSMVVENIKGSRVDIALVRELLDEMYQERILKREVSEGEPKYELIHDCLALTIKSMMSDDEIEIKKAKEFLFAQKRKWLVSEKAGKDLLDDQQLGIIDSQKAHIADELEVEDYEFILKSSIVTEKDLTFWIHLETRNLRSVDEGTKYTWIREIIDNPQEPVWERRAIKALGFVRGDRDQEDFLWDVIFQGENLANSEMAAISLVNLLGENAVVRLTEEAKEKEKNKAALRALAFIKNHAEILAYDGPDPLKTGEVEDAFVDSVKSASEKAPLSFSHTWTTINPFIWKLRFQRGKKGLHAYFKSTTIWGFISTVLIATVAIALGRFSFLNDYWLTHVAEDRYFFTCLYNHLFLSSCGIFIFGYCVTISLNMFSTLFVKQNTTAKLIGCCLGGIVGGLAAQGMFSLVMVFPFNLYVLNVFVAMQGVYLGLVMGFGIFWSQLANGRETQSGNLICTGTCMVLLGVVAASLLMRFEGVDLSEAIGETVRFGSGAIGMAFGRGRVIERQNRKKMTQIN